MTATSEYNVPRSNSSIVTSGDLAIVCFWSLLGLSLSAVLVTSGFVADIGTFLALGG